jgi:hypothetical protein
LAEILALKGKNAESGVILESIVKAKPQRSQERYVAAGQVAWRFYLNGDVDWAERFAIEALQGMDSLAVLQTLFASQARAGKWVAADPHFRRYLRECPATEIVGNHWKEDILFLRDVVVAGKEQWVVDRIACELPAPRNEQWEVIRLALSGEPVQDKRLEPAVRLIAEQFRSSDSVSKFPVIA